MKPDEVIILFDLGDDFQSHSPASDEVVYTIDDDGELTMDRRSFRLRHDLSHYFLRGYYSFQFVETIYSHYLTPKVISSFAQSWSNEALATTTANGDLDFPRLKGYVTDRYTVTDLLHSGITATRLEKIPAGNNFMFSKEENDAAQKAVAIAASLLKLVQEFTTVKGYTLYVVTIPAFPKAFYTQYEANNWEPAIANYDLFLPERALNEMTQDESIPFLAMGQQMYEDELTVDEIKGLFYSDGQGHLTPAGHEYFAKTIFSCFFSPTRTSNGDACATH